MTTIIGVDFSGAGEHDSVGKTWVTKGHLCGITLTIDDCNPPQPISRANLESLLKQLPKGAVAAMDFPFSVPIGFAEFWQPGVGEMPCLWAAAEKLDLEQFYRNLNEFAPLYDFELLRVGDLLFPNAQPCLHHKGRPNMVPMMFRGMQMLHRLWKTGLFQVPPLERSGQPLPVLLEVMPGAALRNYGLPFTRYKDEATEAQGKERRGNRETILNKLTSGASGVQLEMPQKVRDDCIERREGDGLDSLVAATVAARWAKCEADFCIPSVEIVTTLKRNKKHKRHASCQAKGMTKLAAAQREGWIYAPRPK